MTGEDLRRILERMNDVRQRQGSLTLNLSDEMLSRLAESITTDGYLKCGVRMRVAIECAILNVLDHGTERGFILYAHDGSHVALDNQAICLAITDALAGLEAILPLVPTITRIESELHSFIHALQGMPDDSLAVSVVVDRWARKFAQLFIQNEMKPAFDEETAVRIVADRLRLHFPNSALGAVPNSVVARIMNEMVFAARVSAGFSAVDVCPQCHGPIEDDRDDRTVCVRCEQAGLIAELNSRLNQAHMDLGGLGRTPSPVRHENDDPWNPRAGTDRGRA
jgi:hypothetical protein